jgi:hypothetical protein
VPDAVPDFGSGGLQSIWDARGLEKSPPSEIEGGAAGRKARSFLQGLKPSFLGAFTWGLKSPPPKDLTQAKADPSASGCARAHPEGRDDRVFLAVRLRGD